MVQGHFSSASISEEDVSENPFVDRNLVSRDRNHVGSLGLGLRAMDSFPRSQTRRHSQTVPFSPPFLPRDKPGLPKSLGLFENQGQPPAPGWGRPIWWLPCFCSAFHATGAYAWVTVTAPLPLLPKSQYLRRPNSLNFPQLRLTVRRSQAA